MNVAFDHTIFCMQRFGGISRYFCSLIKELRPQGISPRVFALLHRNEYLANSPDIPLIGTPVRGYPPRTARFFLAASGWQARRAIRRWQPDLVHHTYYDASSSTTRRMPSVVTVYDMIHERFAAKLRAGRTDSSRKRAAVESSDHVLAISHSTSRDLQEMWGIDPKKITVTHLAAHDKSINNTGRHEVAADLPTQLKQRPFLLFVGNREGYKNFSGLLKAIAINSRLCGELGLVAFGGRPFGEPAIREISSLGLNPKNVVHLQGDDALLEACYRQAAALVYPSLYEGFGLPPLEAMIRDCPVCVSDRSSIPEVVGDAGEYFDPEQPESISEAIERVLFDTARREQLIAAGRERFREFSWERCAAQTANVYRKVVADAS